MYTLKKSFVGFVLITGYGLTETAGAVVCVPSIKWKHPTKPLNAGSIGILAPGLHGKVMKSLFPLIFIW